MRAHRWPNFRGALIAILALFVSAPLAAAEITLDAPRRTALAGLPGLAGDAPAAATLDGKVVVVAFWASWCPPCHPEFDHLNAAAERYADDGVMILAVNIFEEFGPFKGFDRRDAFLAKKAPRFTVLADGEEVAAMFGEVERIPTVFVFGRDGRPGLHFVHEEGSKKTHVTGEELDAALRLALQS